MDKTQNELNDDSITTDNGTTETVPEKKDDGADTKKELAKSKKTLLTVLIILVIGLLAGVGVILAVVLTTDTSPEDVPAFTRQIYMYAVASDSADGVQLDDAWRMGCSADRFTVAYKDDGVVTVDKNGALKPCDGVADGTNTAVYYKYDGTVVAVFNVTVIDTATYISSSDDLKAIASGATGYYIQTTDIGYAGSTSIEDFRGVYFGNHHAINGLNVSEKGGLFNTAKNAKIYALSLTGVTGTVTAQKAATFGVSSDNKTPSFGLLVNYAYSTDICYCSVSGSASADADDNAVVFYAGGLIGYLNDAEKRSDIDSSINVLQYCDTDAELTITATFDNALNAANSLCVGAVAGYIHNATVTDCKSAGNLSVTTENAERTYVGGTCGLAVKESEKFASDRLHFYDTGSQIVSETDIVVTVNGDNSFFTVFCGGLFGKISDFNLSNVEFSGSLKVGGGVTPVVAGAIAGNLENTNTESVTIDMTVKGVKNGGSVEVTSVGNNSVGKLYGRISDCVTVTEKEPE